MKANEIGDLGAALGGNFSRGVCRRHGAHRAADDRGGEYRRSRAEYTRSADRTTALRGVRRSIRRTGTRRAVAPDGRWANCLAGARAVQRSTRSPHEPLRGPKELQMRNDKKTRETGP